MLPSLQLFIVMSMFSGEAIGCGSDYIWGVDEYTQWWMQKVTYISSHSSWWFHLLDVSLHYFQNWQEWFLLIVHEMSMILWFFQIHNRVSWRVQEKCGASLDCILRLPYSVLCFFCWKIWIWIFLDMMILLWSILSCSWSFWSRFLSLLC